VKATQGIRGVWPLKDLPTAVRYPAVVVCEDVIGSTDSPVAANNDELAEILSQMLLCGFDPERMFAMEVLEPLNASGRPMRSAVLVHPASEAHTVIREIVHRAGLEMARVELSMRNGHPAAWRIDDGPLAMLPIPGSPPNVVEGWMREMAALDSLRTDERTPLDIERLLAPIP